MRLERSPRSHSARKRIERPVVEWREKFFKICGSCAKSHARIERMPRAVESSAAGVGTQEPEIEDIVRKNPEFGAQ